MVYRGMKHRTPVSETDIFENQKCGEIDLEANNNELISRCPKCKERIISIKKIVRNL
jgi:predicted Zn-ribbon and HTH transcriptional regulator